MALKRSRYRVSKSGRKIHNLKAHFTEEQFDKFGKRRKKIKSHG